MSDIERLESLIASNHAEAMAAIEAIRSKIETMQAVKGPSRPVRVGGGGKKAPAGKKSSKANGSGSSSKSGLNTSNIMLFFIDAWACNYQGIREECPEELIEEAREKNNSNEPEGSEKFLRAEGRVLYKIIKDTQFKDVVTELKDRAVNGTSTSKEESDGELEEEAE